MSAILAAAAPHSAPASPGTKVPTVGPNLHFPGSGVLIVLFFVGLVKVVASFLNKRDGGIGQAIAMMIVAVIAIAIVIGTTAFLSQWIDFLSPGLT
jgi:nitrate reductase gamma subunit